MSWCPTCWWRMDGRSTVYHNTLRKQMYKNSWSARIFDIFSNNTTFWNHIHNSDIASTFQFLLVSVFVCYASSESSHGDNIGYQVLYRLLSQLHCHRSLQYQVWLSIHNLYIEKKEVKEIILKGCLHTPTKINSTLNTTENEKQQENRTQHKGILNHISDICYHK